MLPPLQPPLRLLDPDALDLAAFVRPGDRIVCGQCTAEPLTLTRRLVAQAAALGPLEVFVGPLFSDTFAPADLPAGALRFRGYGAMGAASALWAAGLLDVVPIHYSALDAAYASGALQAEVVLLQLAPPPPGAPAGTPFSLGLANDYAAQAARHARVVIAEVNPAVPWTRDAALPADVEVAALVAAAFPPLEVAPAKVGPVERAIAGHVAGLVPDRATLQIGIGAIPDAVLAGLSGHRDLGIHSGVVGDRMVDLIAAGAVTNAHKTIDQGLSVTNTLIGTRRTYDHAARDPGLRVRPAAYTHGPAALGALERFFAINSCVEVDLSGQVNAEQAGGAYVGGTGGLLDFSRASRGGRAVLALPATARRGAVSRIVPRLARTTVAGSDVDVVVTEHGVADLRGAAMAERARRLVAVAAPAFREDLARAAGELAHA